MTAPGQWLASSKITLIPFTIHSVSIGNGWIYCSCTWSLLFNKLPVISLQSFWSLQNPCDFWAWFYDCFVSSDCTCVCVHVCMCVSMREDLFLPFRMIISYWKQDVQHRITVTERNRTLLWKSVLTWRGEKLFHAWWSCWVPEASDPSRGLPWPSSPGLWTLLFPVSQREPVLHGLFTILPSTPTEAGWCRAWVWGRGVSSNMLLCLRLVRPSRGCLLALSRSTGLFLPSPLTVFLAVTFPVSFLKLPPLLTMACNRPWEHSGQPTTSLPWGEGRGLGQLKRGQLPSLIGDEVSELHSGKALTTTDQTCVKEKGPEEPLCSPTPFPEALRGAFQHPLPEHG